MNEEIFDIREVLHTLWSDVARLRKAYDLVMNGHADRAELICQQILSLERDAFDKPVFADMQRLLDLGCDAETTRYVRGYVEAVGCKASTFLEKHLEIYQGNPIRQLVITEFDVEREEFFQADIFVGICALSFLECDVDDDFVAQLIACTTMHELVFIDFGRSDISAEMFAKLADAPHLRTLAWVKQWGVEKRFLSVGIDWDGSVVDWDITPFGKHIQELTAREHIPWIEDSRDLYDLIYPEELSQYWWGHKGRYGDLPLRTNWHSNDPF